ncbi:plasmid pRiA4b ORF-3 family protein [Sporosarcina siberiensis]|uniref:Plasmid pRiA4b ORF-3 family protein n=1 Tax=Sporosarcina siberiensis TaxID=1365606 RepID=A0ABW4SFA5_9BACL
MQIGCTKKLLDVLKAESITASEVDPLFSWHANVLIFNRKKVVVFINETTRYVVVLFGIKAKEFNKFNEVVLQAIRESFQSEGIKEEVINNYFLRVNEVTITKSKDRTSVARLNKASENASVFYDVIDEEAIFQPQLGMKLNRLFVGDGKKSYIYPSEEMFKALQLFAGQPIFETQAVVLKVTLRLENHEVWRRLVVPIHNTFNQLHTILQTAFGWQDSHLHGFTIYDKPQNGKKLIKSLVCHEELLSDAGEVSTILEKGIKLSEYIPKYEQLTYTYDFGDEWKHVIEVEKMIENHEFNYAVCLDGKGNTPPEDVGGEHGYDHYINVLKNPKDDDFEYLTKWGRMQGYMDFDKDAINRALK